MILKYGAIVVLFPPSRDIPKSLILEPTTYCLISMKLMSTLTSLQLAAVLISQILVSAKLRVYHHIS